MEARASSRPGTLLLSHTLSPVLFLRSFLFAFPPKVEKSGLEPCARVPTRAESRLGKGMGVWLEGSGEGLDGSPMTLTSAWLACSSEGARGE